MGKKTVVIGIAVFLVMAAVLFAITNMKSGLVTQSSKSYCGPEGKLVETMPIQSHRSYCVKSDSGTVVPNRPSYYSFSIVDDQGATLRDFEVIHTKIMHVIVVSKDLHNFQHLHPAFDEKTGMFTLDDLTLPVDDHYRIFADFEPAVRGQDQMGILPGVTIFEDVFTGPIAKSENIGSEQREKNFGGYDISLTTDDVLRSGIETTLSFHVSEKGNPVTDLEEYLGALGHTVIIREGTLDFIHAHPIEWENQNGTVRFMVTFPEAGKYKIFSQFQRDNKVITTDFVVTVEPGEKMPSQPMDH